MIHKQVKKWFNIVLLMLFGYAVIAMIPTLLVLGINLLNVERRFFIATFLGYFVGILPFGIILFLSIRKCFKSIKALSIESKVKF